MGSNEGKPRVTLMKTSTNTLIPKIKTHTYIKWEQRNRGHHPRCHRDTPPPSAAHANPFFNNTFFTPILYPPNLLFSLPLTFVFSLAVTFSKRATYTHHEI